MGKYFVLTFLNLANITKAVVFPMTPRRPVTAAHTHMIVSSGRGGEMFRDGEDVIFISRNTVLIMSFKMTPYSQPKYNQLEKLEAARSAYLWLPLVTLLGITRPYSALLCLTRPYSALLCLTRP